MRKRRWKEKNIKITANNIKEEYNSYDVRNCCLNFKNSSTKSLFCWPWKLPSLLNIVLLFYYYGFCWLILPAKAESTPVENNQQQLSKMFENENTAMSFSMHKIDCYRLKIGQFKCDPYELDEETQQPKGCQIDNFAPINCTLREGLICDETSFNLTINGHLDRIQLTIPCQYTNSYSFEITLILSIFLGMFGIDRFYLGYPAIGLLKFCTLGFLFLGQFIDIILIAMQVVKPADGSNYIIKFFGPRLTIIQHSLQQRYGLMDFGMFNHHNLITTENDHIPLIVINNLNHTYHSMVSYSQFDCYFYPMFNLSFNHLPNTTETPSF